jgi:hypothetical protein
MIYDPVPPFRRDFDAARDPYTARNALGITATGGGGPFQPLDADLTALAALTGVNVIYYRSAADTWSPVTIGTGISFTGGTLAATAGGGPFQPQDADLTSIAGYSGTGTWLYRSTADTWSPVTFGTGISFSGGTLSSTVSTAGLAPINSPTFTGDPKAPTPIAGDNDTSIATTAFVTGAISTASAGLQPLDADLTSLAAASSINAIYYRSAANTWGPITIGSGLTFTSGTLDAPVFTSGAKGEVPASGGGTVNFLRADGTWTTPAGGGDVTQVGNNTFTGNDYFNLGSNLPLVVGHNAKIATGYSFDVNGTSVITGIANTRWSADATGAQLTLRKSRGASVGTNAVVSSGDTLGKVSFAGNHGTGFQADGPAVSGICNSAPFGTSTPGYVLIEATTIGGARASAATFKDTGCALLGVNDGSNAAAGWVGEFQSASFSAQTIGTGVTLNVGQLTLTAGDWDVWCNFSNLMNASATLAYANTSLSLTANTHDNTLGRIAAQTVQPGNYPASTFVQSRFAMASSFIVYAVGSNAGASITYNGVIMARRVR